MSAFYGNEEFANKYKKNLVMSSQIQHSFLILFAKGFPRNKKPKPFSKQKAKHISLNNNKAIYSLARKAKFSNRMCFSIT